MIQNKFNVTRHLFPPVSTASTLSCLKKNCGFFRVQIRSICNQCTDQYIFSGNRATRATQPLSYRIFGGAENRLVRKSVCVFVFALQNRISEKRLAPDLGESAASVVSGRMTRHKYIGWGCGRIIWRKEMWNMFNEAVSHQLYELIYQSQAASKHCGTAVHAIWRSGFNFIGIR